MNNQKKLLVICCLRLFLVDIFCWFDDSRSRLFATFRTNISVLEIKPEVKNRIMTHDRPIVAARYLTKQKQVMIVCQGGDISFWSLEGQRTKRFNEPNAAEHWDTTCLGFDEFGEKFYAGGSDGKIRVWNYNGRVTHTLDAGKGSAVEITQIEALKRRVVAVGWSRYLAVFRDLTQTDGRPSLPTEWHGEKDKSEGHADDIVCMAVTGFFPQFLASGSADGDICVWNTSSELFFRRLDQRKRNPNNTQARLQDNAADFTITVLRFLDKRMVANPHNQTTANLVSCGGVGFVRFWNFHAGKLLGEFQAHSDVSSIIMEIDIHNKYLATGDVNGTVRLWDIEQYCIQSDLTTIEKNLPLLLTEFTAHSDSITCIDFFEKDERTFILTSSSDCSVVLSDINGNAYGTFGQPNQWRLDVILTKAHDERSQISQSKTNDESQDEQHLRDVDNESQTEFSQDFDNMSSVTDEEMLTRRSNVWESSLIGVTYQEKRTNRRQRNQPCLITKKDYVQWEKTGIAPGGAYGALDTFDPPAIPEQKKNAYLDTTYIWHSTSAADNTRRRQLPTMIGENLKSAFDERSIFPKYILDYEAKQKQVFEATIQQGTTGTSGHIAALQSLVRQAGEAAGKLKRQSSTSTLHSDSKAQ